MNLVTIMYCNLFFHLVVTTVWAAPQIDANDESQTKRPYITVDSGRQAIKAFREREKELIAKERDAVERIAKTSKVEHNKLRDELLNNLEGLLQAETKAGNLDEALELRSAIKYYKRYQRKSYRAHVYELTKEIKDLKARLAGTNPEPKIPKESVRWNDHSYLRVDVAHGQSTAQNIAHKSGGHLVQIENQEEQAFVHNLIRSGKQRWYILDGSDEAEEGMWRWSDGRSITYLDWDADEPTGAKSDSKSSFSHALFMNSSTGKMHDGIGGQRAGFVIEWDQ